MVLSLTFAWVVMEKEAYREQLQTLSIHARFGVALRIFERYVRVRGIEDDSVWAFLEHMWQFPMALNKDAWEKKRGDLADFGLGDEVPEELEEELASLGIDEDYFDVWTTCVVEIAWGSVLHGPQLEESMKHLLCLVDMAEETGLGLPKLASYLVSTYDQNDGWGEVVDMATQLKWQTAEFEADEV